MEKLQRGKGGREIGGMRENGKRYIRGWGGGGERGASHLSIFMGLEPAVENTQQQASLYPPAEIHRYTGRYRALYLPTAGIDIQVDIELSLSFHQQI
jgi:hypothetical protein